MFSRIRRAVRLFRTGTSSGTPAHGGHDLAQTLKDSSNPWGAKGGSTASPNNAFRIMAKGAGDYTKSFKKKK